MSAVDAFLQQLDDTWSHEWESVRRALDGVTEEEAAWQAECYRAEEREEGWPQPGSIWWQVAHVAHCKRYYTAMVAARGTQGRPPVPPRAPAATFADEMRQLQDAHAAQRVAIAAVRDEDLVLACGNEMPLDEFLAMSIRHDAWHAAQIAVARRLWRTRAGA